MKKLFHIQPAEQNEMVQPVLALTVSDSYFAFAISNTRSNQLYHLAGFSADEMNPATLAEIISLHPEASGAFYQVSVCYQYSQHILVPQEFYNSDNFGELWQQAHGAAAGRNIVSETVAAWQLNSVYAVPREVQQFLFRRYPSASFKHFPSVALKNISDSTAGLLQIDFGIDEFELVAINQNKLLLAERFEYVTPHDVAYHLLNLCHLYSMNQYQVQVKVSGLIDKDSALYKELYQYFMHISFRNAAWNHSEYPVHFFTVLNDTARCAS